MQLESVLRGFDGAARREQLLAAGISLTEMYGAVAAGAVMHPYRGVFAMLGADLDVALARAFRAQVGCVSACAHWGLPILERSSRTHVSVPAERSQSRRGVRPVSRTVVHRGRDLGASTWVELFGAIDQAARCTSPMGQLILVDSALQKGLIVPGDVKYLRLGTRRRREWLARSASAQAESLLETVTRATLDLAGFKARPQARFDDVGRVDLLVDEQVVVEADGGQHFTSKQAIRTDRRRDRILQLGETPVLRYVYSDLIPDPSEMVRDVACLLKREPLRGWQGRLAWALAAPSLRPHP